MSQKYRPPRNQNSEEDHGEPEVEMESGFSKIIVVDNVPVVTKDKYEKLKTVINRIFGAFGAIHDIHLIQDVEGGTKGYVFIEYTTPEAARTAVEKTHKSQMDAKHTLLVHHYDEFNKIMDTPDAYSAPVPPAHVPQENLRSWLQEKRVIDQYALRYADQTEVLWNDIKMGEEPETVVKRKDWSDTFIGWSPAGSYIFTVHTKGIAVWGGPSWNKIMRFPHDGVKLVDFSPCEKYIVTCSPIYETNDNPKDPQCIIVWDIRSGRKLRGYAAGAKGIWPIFKWSHDDKFLARLGENAISVYETPNMDLIGGKSITVPNIKEFSWCPTQNIISYFVPELNSQPAAVAMIDIPSRTLRRQKNLFNVTDCKLYWQSNGDYLAVKIDKVLKTKKPAGTTFEVFRMRVRDIPTEQIELKEAVTSFAWEPKGHRFAVIHGEAQKTDISFFTMDPKIKLLKTLEKKTANALHWSPQGDIIVLANLQSNTLAMEFFNVNDMETMASEEHYNASHIEWDPTGRFIATSVSFWIHQVETGYNIYSFQGKLLRHVLKERFYQFLWRPRPPTLLTADKVQYIKKNISKYFKQFKEDDDAEALKREEERFHKREEMHKQFQDYLQSRYADYEREREERRRIRGEDSDGEEEYDEKEDWVEEIEDRKEIIVDS